MHINHKAYDVSAFASKDSGRPTLQTVAIWLKAGAVASTDGHVCALVAPSAMMERQILDAMADESPCLVGAKEWGHLFAGWGKESALTISRDDEALAVHDDRGRVTSIPLMRCDWPTIQQVWPLAHNGGSLKGLVGFNALTLTKTLKWMESSTRDKRGDLTLRFHGDCKAPLLVTQRHDDTTLRALVMPIRLTTDDA